MEYYKELLIEAVNSAEFSEHQQKHLMTPEKTRRTIDEDLRHDPIGRFDMSESAMRALLAHMIKTDMQIIRDWCGVMATTRVGEYVKKDYDIGPLPNKVGVHYTRNGEEDCHYFHIAFSFKRGTSKELDRVRIVTFFPAASPRN